MRISSLQSLAAALLAVVCVSACQCQRQRPIETPIEEGQPCDNDEQCETSICDSENGGPRICLRNCTMGCRSSQLCTTLEGDRRACVQERAGLCKACTQDSDCPQAADKCIVLGETAFCGRDCSFDKECPNTFRCGPATTVEGALVQDQCQPSSGTCDCIAATTGLAVPCEATNNSGTCIGIKTCYAPQGFSACSAVTPADETCNALDDDCDGRIDEDLGQLTCGLGECLRTVAACLGGAAQQCVPGPAMPERCDGRDNDCDGAIDNGINVLADVQNCGSCGVVCPAINAVPSCNGGVCGIASCLSGWTNRDGDPINGCEFSCAQTNGGVEACDGLDNDCDGVVDNGFDLATDATNCGQCGLACNVAGNTIATYACVARVCAIDTCAAGRGNCNQLYADGCETNFDSDPTHCGDCGTACSTPNASAACVNGACGVGTCNANHANCNGTVSDGCEVNLLGDLANCGACGTACNAANATSTCSNGSCAYACTAGHYDLNGSAADGCEYLCLPTLGGVEACDAIDNDCDGQIDEGFNLTTDAQNCGQCGRVCTAAYGTAQCSASNCVVAACDPGHADCNGSYVDGCEIDTRGAVQNCGACGNVCSAANGTPSCTSGSCGLGACNAGFANCNTLAADGCEKSVLTDVNNCGGCGVQCTAAHGSAVCNSGTCAVDTCTGTWRNCDGSYANGCETNTNSAADNCGACGNLCDLPNATAVCTGGGCGIGSCNAGWRDCDGNAANGCEVNTNGDTANCGTCGHVCSNAGGSTACSGGTCGIACDPAHADCDNNANNGCERLVTSDVNNCGGCNVVCSLPHVTTPYCAAGSCGITTCATGWADCDGNPANGCEVDVRNDADNCGVCSNVCNATNGAPTCSNGSCNVVCTAGFGNCDGNAANGCEVTLSSNTGNCGACGNACPATNGAATCAAGLCGIACTGGWGDCNAAPGCETNLNTSVTSCGGCGLACNVPNATPACVGGACGIASCNPGFADCNGNPADGCEVNLQSDTQHCGTCATSCGTANGSATCAAGACGITCAAGFLNCDAVNANGCEVNIAGDVNNCGGCGVTCSAANATSTCTTGTCGFTCLPNFWNLDGNTANGCEYACIPSGVETCNGRDDDCDGVTDEGFNLMSDAQNCGACGTTCSALGGTAACQTGACVVASCDVGRANCDGLYANGCEVNTLADTANCGACAAACTVANGTAACSGGACGVLSCVPGYANCNGLVTDGCEKNTLTDSNNCGACGTNCTLAHANGVCNSGSCGVGSCQGAWRDCDSAGSNGCEVNSANDLDNCGACNVACTVANGTPACVTGTCTVASCNPGFINCDGAQGNGCEVNAFTDVNNCGACGNVCPTTNGAAACSGGTCGIVCGAGFADCNGNSADGCETSTSTSITSCGGCNLACVTPNATPSCTAGACGIATCNSGFADCDGNVANGCEVNLQTDTAHCGSCAGVCNTPNATAACVNGACGVGTCAPGYSNCNGTVADGCEANLGTSVSNCGTCGVTCSAANAASSCAAGSCTYACLPNYFDLDGNTANGCEYACIPRGAETCNGVDDDCDGLTDEGFNLASDVNNCGACNVTCTAVNGAAACVSGSCTVASCNAGFSNCDGLPGNGCEVNTATSLSNCGACGANCSVSNGTPVCSGGTCGVGTCAAGFADCNSFAGDGCERSLLTDPNNCGGCGNGCVVTNGVPVCNSGACGVGSCNSTWRDCNNSVTDGCEVNTLSDVANCGACNAQCNTPQANSVCNSGACGVSTCYAGHFDCNGAAADGCEVNAFNDPANCGGCGVQCSSAGGTPACSGGICGIACTAGFADCNSTAADGCETNVSTSAANCGGCGLACSPANAVGACNAGACGIAACNPGFADCNGNPADGCEVNLATDAQHCGTCVNTCSNSNGTASCSGGTCGITCSAGFANCDGLAGNGCEVFLNGDTGNCGACGNSCPSANGVAACASGSCAITCNTGWGNCDGNVANACETNLSTTVTSCGTCGNACNLANSTEGCLGGVCFVQACDPGWGDCDGNPANGCEVNLNTDATHCGSCATSCSGINSSSTCNSGTCVNACAAGFADCDGNPANGCEVNLNADPTHCGSCATVCNATNGDATCVSGSCGITCDLGWGDCNAGPGCETNLTSTSSHCGACGNLCNLPSAASVCTNSLCTIAACNVGRGDCNGNSVDGCEVDITTSVANCGTCGNTCNLPHVNAETCAAGNCGIGTCDLGWTDCNGIASDGCEVHTGTDTNNCGACGNVCNAAGGLTACSGGVCGITCDAAHADCNSSAADGCETLTASNTSNCGGCGVVCAPAHATPYCSLGACGIATCAAGWADCNGNVADGCEVNIGSDATHCGSCGNVCSTSNGTASCTAGTCGIACAGGFGNCDGNTGNGCETNLTTDPAHCGTCATVCSNANGAPLCNGALCATACNAGYGDCDGTTANGCETNTSTSLLHCGACNNACNLAHATEQCVAGACGIASCDPGWADCDGNPANGCEADLTLVNNCGGCGTVCNGTNGTATCSGAPRVCGIACAAGFANCDGNLSNGCEVNLNTDPAHCNTCATVCSSTNGDPSCSAGVCGIGCDTGFGNCNGSTADGCEVNTNVSTANCGGCGTVCTTANGTPVCSNGSCGIGACGAGFGNCNGNVVDGCETNTNTSTTNCGGCGVVCAVANGAPTCTTGTCAVGSCSAGYADCDATYVNGCEVNTTSNANNCGACGNNCGALANVGITACVGSACTIGNCVAGFGNCNGTTADGCEAPLNTVANCTACGNNCAALPHVSTSTCGGAGCVITACAVGWSDCNGLASDGCEVNTATSTSNCGACGFVCSSANGTASCSAGSCGIACTAGFGDCVAGNNGCETNLNTDPTHCGSCAGVCSASNGTATCTGGACGTLCNAGFGNCDGNAANGCETSLTTTSDCGQCGEACSTNHGTASCSGAPVACGIACTAGYGNCNGTVVDGCETALTSPTNCGACGFTCALPHVTTNTCSGAGVCGVGTCEAGWGDCDGVAANGCEVNLNAPGSCGATCASRVVCSSTNGAATCSAGVCGITCNSGYGNCDGSAANGCEVNLNTDATHCGLCATACSTNNGTASCSAGTCGIACSAGYGNCDGSNVNGCETALNTTSNCGVCGNTCQASNGVAACTAGTCAVGSCNVGYCDINGGYVDGCEVSTNVGVPVPGSVQYCGSCSAPACNLPNVSQELCNSGACGVGTCAAGYGNCDANPANGCEVNVTNTAAHCGACFAACNLPNVATETCASSTCGVGVCSAGYRDCNTVANDGCEIDSQTDVNNCGSCGNVCNLPNVSSETCSGGNCGIGVCAVGYGNCDGNAPNGCETNIYTSMSSCGACGSVCSLANASEACVSGTCQVTSCDVGYTNCNGTQSDGCEVHTSVDVNNCGACGNVCTRPASTHTIASCGSNACSYVCAAGWYDLNGSGNGSDADGCEYSCNSPLSAPIPPGTADDPDPSFIDYNCDGIDGNIPKAWFVSATGTGATCSMAQPCTLAQALANVAAEPMKNHIYMRAGTYPGIVQIDTAAQLYGGYSGVNWARASYTTSLVQFTNSTSSTYLGEYLTVLVTGTGVVLDNLQVVAPSAVGRIGSGEGRSSQAIYAAAGAGLTVTNSRIVAAAGVSGLGGAAGTSASGASAAGGTAGAAGQQFSTACNDSRRAGGAGGSNTCEGTVTNGGNGGNGGQMDNNCPFGFSATSGLTGGAGSNAGGAAGTGGGTCGGGVGTGASGGSGANGSGGVGAGGGAFSAGFFYGIAGGDGTVGSHGRGGGGGGGSGGCDTGTDTIGAGGGGGGAGGCRAPGSGSGGRGGGASIGILAVGAALNVTDTQIVRGTGGAGGSGGPGGTGQPGGGVGAGGASAPNIAAGGNGGAGGSGGASGGGGGGAGGLSYCVVRTGGAYSGNVGAANCTGGTGGAAGAGGSTGIPGGAGTAGAVGTVLTL